MSLFKPVMLGEDGRLFTKADARRIFARIPELHTRRLLLRRMMPSDAYDMYEYACRADVTRYLTWEPHPSRDYTRQYLEFINTRYKSGDFYDWAIIWRADGDMNEKMIGTCGFTRFDYNNNFAEVGYVINPAYRGRGVAPEALRRVMEFGFEELGLNRIEARYMVGNDVSRRVMEKVGMHFEGIRRRALLYGNAYRDIGYCSILAEDFRASRND